MEVVLDRVSGMEKIELLDQLDRIVAIINDDESGDSSATANVGGDIDSMLRGTSQPEQQFDAKALQNRDRSRQSYVMQMQKIASNPDYDRASTSKTPDTGAPMVFVRNKQIPSSTSGKSEVVTMSDGKGGTVKIKAVYAVVEAEDLTASHDASGGKVDAYGGDTGIMALNNGRTAALKQAYKQESAGEYRNALVSDKSHGISAAVIEKMHHPVLVRVFSESALIGIDDPGAASNTSAGAALSASEQAETDAKKLDDAALMQYQGGDVNSAGNRDFVRAFVRSMGGSDAVGDMQTADGMISADGVKRIEGALVAKAYGDNAILNDLTESPDSDLKSLGVVLKDVAGRWAVMKSGAKDGAINRDMDITPQLNEAIAMIRKARQQGNRISELVNQNDMFSGQTNPVTEALLRLMFRGDDMARIRSADKIKKAIHGFIDKAMSTTDGADMFGFKATPMDLIKQQQNDIQNEENAGKAQKGLFDSVAEYFEQCAAVFDSIADAVQDVETNPTEAQKQSGNYRKGHAVVHGIPVTIENPKGSTRSGTSPVGRKWSNTMNAHYGYFKGTEGADGDHVDAYFGDDAESASPGIFVVNQVDPETGDFDEHKVMFGYPDAETAKKAYLGNFEKGWNGFGSIKQMSLDGFKEWLEDGDTTAILDSLFIESEVRDYGKKYQAMEDRKDPVTECIQDDYDDGIQALIVTRESGKKTEERRQWDYDKWDEFEAIRDDMKDGEKRAYILANSKLVEVKVLENASHPLSSVMDSEFDMSNNKHAAFDSIRDLILDSALSGMEKIELLDELDDIADKIDDPSVSGMEKIDLLDRFDEIVDLINGEDDGEESGSVLPDAEKSVIYATDPSVPDNYDDARQKSDEISANLDRKEKNLKSFIEVKAADLGIDLKSRMGLTPDEIKSDPEYASLKRGADSAFRLMQTFNGVFVKKFKKEERARRDAITAERESLTTLPEQSFQ